MSDSLEYTEEEARQEEAAYRAPSMATRRRLVRDRLDLRSGEEVLSVGCGPGFEPAELAEAVGPSRHRSRNRPKRGHARARGAPMC